MLRQAFDIAALGLQLSRADKTRLLTPLLFSFTLLLVVRFSFDESSLDPQAFHRALFVAQAVIAVVLSVQSSLSQAFVAEEEDGFFTAMASSCVHAGAWFLGKWMVAVVEGALVCLATILAAFILDGSLLPGLEMNFWGQGALLMLLLLFLTLAGLAALGIFLSAMVLKARSRAMLFPILYFPLAVPLLLAASQGSLALLTAHKSALLPWLGLLVAFDIIYLMLGLTLFEEVVREL